MQAQITGIGESRRAFLVSDSWIRECRAGAGYPTNPAMCPSVSLRSMGAGGVPSPRIRVVRDTGNVRGEGTPPTPSPHSHLRRRMKRAVAKVVASVSAKAMA